MKPIVIELRAYTLEETETEPLPVSSLAFNSPEIFESQWFQKILTLIFVMAMVPTAYFLWAVWLGGTSDLEFSVFLICGLLTQLATHAFVLVIVTALCLYLHFNSLPPLPILSIRYHRVDGRKQFIIQKCLWGLWIGFMTAGLVVLNYFFSLSIVILYLGWNSKMIG